MSKSKRARDEAKHYDRDKEQLDKAIDGLEHMKMTLPMLEAHRDTIVAALVYLLKLRLGA